MPIIEDLNLLSKTRLIIWEITEDLEDLRSGVILDKDSVKLLADRKSEIHKKQFLAIRSILKEISVYDQNLKYNELGRPILIDDKNLSITHSGNYAALIISDHKVGIDIEVVGDKILKITDKFLETELIYPQVLNKKTALIYWNIKESIFKSVENSGIDFRKNMIVIPFNQKDNYTKSWYINNEEIYSFDTHFKISKNYTLAYVIKN
jgi:phosphopantetheinyl transferase